MENSINKVQSTEKINTEEMVTERAELREQKQSNDLSINIY